MDVSEFILEPGKTPMLIAGTVPPSLGQIMGRLKQSATVQPVECGSPHEAITLVRKLEAALVVFYARTEDEALALIPFLQQIRIETRKGRIRVIVSSPLPMDYINSFLKSYGISETIAEPINPKTLQFKVDRHVKALPKPKKPDSDVRSISHDQEAEESRRIAGDGPTKSANSQAGQVKFVAALPLESDCWPYAGGSAKKIGGRWVIKLAGPTSTEGRWEHEKNPESSREQYWKWVPAQENDPYVKEEGHWFFRGNIPEYRGGLWNFTSRQPLLAFLNKGKSLGDKFRIESDGSIVIAKDGPAAIRAQKQIEASIAESEKQRQRKKGAQGRESPDQEASLEARESGDSKRSDDPYAEVVGDDREPEKIGENFSFADPLGLESDFWLIQDQKPRRIAKKWAVKLMGPGTAAGRWIETKAQGSAEETWQWIPTNPETDPFHKEEGAWLFQGLLPKFQEDGWLFVGKQPELGFYFEGQSFGAKISCKPSGELVLARDSEAGKRLAPAILATYENVIKQDGGAEEGEKRLQAKDDEVKGLAENDSGGEQAIEETFQFLVTHFGERGGKWIFASADAQGEKWYLFVPKSVLDHGVGDPKSWPNYWVHLGPSAPAFKHGKWIFQKNKPEKVKRFEELVPAIQEFLVSKKSESAFVIEMDPDREGTLLEGEFGNDRKNSPELEIEIGSVAGNEIRDLRTQGDQEGHGPELDTGGEADEEDSLPFREEPDDEDAGVDDFSDRRADFGKEKKAFADAGLTELPIADVDIVDDPKGSNRPKSSKKKSEGDETLLDLHKEAAEQMIRTAAGPTKTRPLVLSPLALAFLVSEMACRRGAQPKEVANRFCDYLSASCGGVRVELWANTARGWSCAGARDGTEPEFGPVLQGFEARPEIIRTRNPATGAGTLIVPILGRPSAGTLLGALVVGQKPESPQSSKTDDEAFQKYLGAAAEMTRGLLLAA